MVVNTYMKPFATNNEAPTKKLAAARYLVSRNGKRVTNFLRWAPTLSVLEALVEIGCACDFEGFSKDIFKDTKAGGWKRRFCVSELQDRRCCNRRMNMFTDVEAEKQKGKPSSYC